MYNFKFDKQEMDFWSEHLDLLCSAKAIVAKIVVDQLIWTPISICIFYSVFKTMEGQMSQIKQTIKEKFWPTLLAGYAIW